MNDLTKKIKPYLLDYVNEITTKSKGKDQYICPLCNSGTGKNGTGAFTVYHDNSYHCFACGSHGDIFSLYGAINNLSINTNFPRIIDELSKKYNLPSSYYTSTPNNSNSWVLLRSHVYTSRLSEN